MGYSESTFSKYAFGRGGGGHKKEYAVYARENDDNYGRPLRHTVCGMNLPFFTKNVHFSQNKHRSIEQTEML